jgi:hypothetical protein
VRIPPVVYSFTLIDCLLMSAAAVSASAIVSSAPTLSNCGMHCHAVHVQILYVFAKDPSIPIPKLLICPSLENIPETYLLFL